MALSSIAQLLAGDSSRAWNSGSHQPTVVTYSFASTSEGFRPGFQDDPAAAAQPFSAAQQASIHSAINAWGNASGLAMVEVPDSTTDGVVDIRLRMAQIYTWDSYSAYSPATGGDISLNTRIYGSDSLAPGTMGYGALLLTVGYALGLKNVEASLPNQTVMASLSANNPSVTALQTADIEAIQYLYGTQQDQDAFHIHWSWDTLHQGLRHDGNDSSQTIEGTQGRDIIFAYGGNDILLGQNGNDLLAAGTGNNTTDGGEGLDTLRTDLFRQKATMADLHVGNELTAAGKMHLSVNGTLAGWDEKTAFTGIETIVFADGRLVFDDTDPVAQVTRLYQAALGRLPDPTGQETWTTRLLHDEPLSLLAKLFLDSDEFLARFGRPDDTGFITRAYQQALGRDPDADGMVFWQDKLAHGMTRAELLVGFSESDENRANTSGLLNKGLWDADDNVVDVARLYQAVLGRLPDDHGLATWVQHREDGMTLPEMANRFAASTEFAERFPATDNLGFVNLVYLNTLGRGPDPIGQAFWLDRLAHGSSRGELVAGFGESQEFIQLTSHALVDHGITFA